MCVYVNNISYMVIANCGLFICVHACSYVKITLFATFVSFVFNLIVLSCTRLWLQVMEVHNK